MSSKELQSTALKKAMQPLEAHSRQADMQVLSLINQSLKNGQAIPVNNN